MLSFYMMIGVPASGKSTWISKQSFDWENTVVISTDNIIEERAAAQGKTYSEVFKDEIKSATVEMDSRLQDAIANKKNIIWDQTNLTKKTRKSKLASIPQEYEKIAVFFPTPDKDELKSRLSNRPGKSIPANIILAMISQLEEPSKVEGFNVILTIT